jgi:hypothetical protein
MDDRFCDPIDLVIVFAVPEKKAGSALAPP